MWVFQTTASHIKANNYLNMGVNLRNSGYPQGFAAAWGNILLDFVRPDWENDTFVPNASITQ
jgi:hypothetical protein